MWTWYRNWRRTRLLTQPFPQAWETWIQQNCRQFPRLAAVDQDRLRRDVQILVAEKHWEGCSGQAITDEIRVTVSAHAALLGLGFDAVPFERLLSILIYPDTFVSRQVRRAPWGGVEEADEPRLGEAWYQGPIVLSWREVQEQCIATDAGRNVVIHEFAHLLDMQNHEVDGIPALAYHIDAEQWVAVFRDEFEKLIRQARHRRKTVLDYYGTTSEAEFFAVASEAFFERAVQLREESPELYAILREFYRQDPASRAPELI